MGIMEVVIRMHYENQTRRKKEIIYGNRGMHLEQDLNDTNTFYLLHNRAVIYKKPTPITIVKVDYPSRMEAVIKEAYFKTPSTTDYNGVYKGKYIDFEAKETKLTSFPLANIHVHQIKHLEMIIKQGGIGFLIVRFLKYKKTFLLEGKDFLTFLETKKRKSIPLSYFEQKGHIIKEKYQPRLDYLEIIDQLFFKGEML